MSPQMPKPKPKEARCLSEALDDVLAERALSLRQLAQLAEVNVAHLSRVKAGTKLASGELATRLARALELPDDYFPEAREEAVIDAIRSDPALRERLYAQLRRKR